MCVSELQGLQSRLQEIRELDAEVLGISTDTTPKNQNLADSAMIEFPLLSDTELAAIDAFGVRHVGASMEGTDIARPAVFIVGRDGQIAWRGLTDNWRIRVRAEMVLEQLRALP